MTAAAQDTILPAIAYRLASVVAFATMGALAFADIPQPRLSAATSLQGTAQQLTRAVGVALAAGAMQASMLIGGRVQPAPFDFSVAFACIP